MFDPTNTCACENSAKVIGERRRGRAMASFKAGDLVRVCETAKRFAGRFAYFKCLSMGKAVLTDLRYPDRWFIVDLCNAIPQHDHGLVRLRAPEVKHVPS